MKAIIFDFDGTIADTLPICYYAFQSVFKEFDNKELSSDEIKEMFGPSETGIIRENLANENKDEAIELFYKKYLESHSLVKQNEEMDELLQLLKDEGIKLGIVTGKSRRSLDISLQALKLEGFFDVMITGDDVVSPKPDPEGVNKALTRLGIQKDEAIFIGDSDADIHAGLQANVYTIGVQWLPEYQTAEFTVQPNFTFTSIADFIKYLKANALR
ncbi:HAD family hydrolase [Bacillus sp. CECT 9360]|uniref:HAD family hydrolase n=1 Tax=Bacillus sp. CECT 9360 TaxID=2845821 RepID=UPI001E59E17F|nr:HAD family hydrolase [Bacillus sp. CECT 9360]